MELDLTRSAKIAKSSIGELTINGVFECFILEDKDRGMRLGMTISELMNLKVKTKTAIPTGRYEIVVSFSDRFQKTLPLLLDVPAYENIGIHSGNTDEDTEGFLLPGKTNLLMRWVAVVLHLQLCLARSWRHIKEKKYLLP